MVNNQELNDCSFLGTPLCNSSELFFLGNDCSQDPESSSMEGFQVEGLSPSKMVKVHSVLESMDRY